MNLTLIGKVGKTHGTNGGLRLRVDDPYTDSVLEAEVLFVQVGGQPAPYFVEDWISEAPPIVKLEEVDQKESAQQLSGQELYLRDEDLLPEVAEEEDYRVLIGYRIYDQEEGAVGKIEDIMELPEQVLAVVNYEGREILIPVHQDFVLDIDQKAKAMHMNLPNGLLGL